MEEAPLELPGVESILIQSADVGWETDLPTLPKIVDLFEGAERALEQGKFGEVANLADEIASQTLQPSQEMRLQYLRGRLFSDLQDYDQAYAFYEMALDIADQHNDLDSQILLTAMAGEVLYGKMRNREALLYFREALAMWRIRASRRQIQRVEPEVKIREMMGRLLWLLGESEEASGALAQAATTALRRRDTRYSPFLRDVAAYALWTLMLTFRARSDMLNGDVGYLHASLRRGRASIKLFESVGTSAVNMARLYIQIAEIYLDLAELHTLRGATAAARSTRKQAHDHATYANELLHLSTDRWAVQLAELTLLRHDIQTHSPLDAIRTLSDIEARLLAIERAAADFQDRILSAKSATLRAEWLLQFDDKDAARQALLLALKGFHGNGVGMATRAHRLLRRMIT
ncbi:MAG TPA: tetratricopeptide repeat protein [Ktedonobacterales bacterium]|nr:tetratricopeptide repeat protein [Ktedonobacterales bacterium]